MVEAFAVVIEIVVMGRGGAAVGEDQDREGSDRES